MPGEGGLTGDTLGVGERIGYAQVPIEAHGPTTHRNAFAVCGAESDRAYLDPRAVGMSRARPGLREAMATSQATDEFASHRRDRSTVTLLARGAERGRGRAGVIRREAL